MQQFANGFIKNDFFSAGVGLMLLTALWGYVSVWLQHLWTYMERKLYFKIHIDNTDEAFQWILGSFSKCAL